MSSDTGSISGPKIVSVDDIFDSLRYANGQVISGSRAKPTHQGGTVSKCHGVSRTHWPTAARVLDTSTLSKNARNKPASISSCSSGGSTGILQSPTAKLSSLMNDSWLPRLAEGLEKRKFIGVRARGLGAATPQTQANPLFFGQKLFFSGTSQQPKMKKIFLCSLNEKKTEFILSIEIKYPKSGFLLIVIGWGESGKVILQVSIAVFRALSKNFSGKDGSAPLVKNWPVHLCISLLEKKFFYRF